MSTPLREVENVAVGCRHPWYYLSLLSMKVRSWWGRGSRRCVEDELKA